MVDFHETARFEQKSHILKISHICENPTKNVRFSPKWDIFNCKTYQNLPFPIPHRGGRNTLAPLLH